MNALADDGVEFYRLGAVTTSIITTVRTSRFLRDGPQAVPHFYLLEPNLS